jgi:hypothetical protein
LSNNGSTHVGWNDCLWPPAEFRSTKQQSPAQTSLFADVCRQAKHKTKVAASQSDPIEIRQHLKSHQGSGLRPTNLQSIDRTPATFSIEIDAVPTAAKPEVASRLLRSQRLFFQYPTFDC